MSTIQKKLSRKLREDFLKDTEDAFTSLNDHSNILCAGFRVRILHVVQGKMDDPETCKIYGYLISTLNASFTDYDFSSVKPGQFRCVESVSDAMNDINRHLCEVSEVNMGSSSASFL